MPVENIQSTPKGNRLHIGIFGNRNVGKSSFINAFTNQEISIVSPTPGTTTDPVEKAYELHNLGPVLLIDTAGLDDTGDLGSARIKKSKQAIKKSDIVFILLDNHSLNKTDKTIIATAKDKNIPYFILINKSDLINQNELTQILDTLHQDHQFVFNCSAKNKTGINEIKKQLTTLFKNKTDIPIVNDLIPDNSITLLVMPQDKEAPTGRLILPQAQTIRELLDNNKMSINITPAMIPQTLKSLNKKPNLVITDSQAFQKVSQLVPKDINLTSFSILFARQKGDLATYINGIKALNNIQDNDKILIAELCSHHAIKEDIGRDKIPQWLRSKTGKEIIFDITSGKDFPDNLSQYKLVIQCGGCMVNRNLIVDRINQAKKQNIPITNYGILIAHIHNILQRSIQPLGASIHE